MPIVVDLDPDERKMLNEALSRARTLVAELDEQKKQVDAAPPRIDPQKLAEGRHAMIKGIASARRMLAALEDAEQIADAPDDAGDDNEA